MKWHVFFSVVLVSHISKYMSQTLDCSVNSRGHGKITLANVRKRRVSMILELNPYFSRDFDQFYFHSDTMIRVFHSFVHILTIICWRQWRQFHAVLIKIYFVHCWFRILEIPRYQDLGFPNQYLLLDKILLPLENLDKIDLELSWTVRKSWISWQHLSQELFKEIQEFKNSISNQLDFQWICARKLCIRCRFHVSMLGRNALPTISKSSESSVFVSFFNKSLHFMIFFTFRRSSWFSSLRA